MGTWAGHTLPGSLFIFFGLTWAIKSSYRYFALGVSKKRRCTRCKWDMIEILILIFCGSFGMVMEQVLPWEPKFHLTNLDTGVFIKANNWSHSTMYSFFILHGASTILVMKLPKIMPHCLHHITMALAFGIEGYLFYFHTHGREELDVRVHVLLLFAIWPTSIFYIILCFLDKNENIASSYIIWPKVGKMTKRENQSSDSTSLLQNGDAMDHEGLSVNRTGDSENIPLDSAPYSWAVEQALTRSYQIDQEYQRVLANYKKIFTIKLCIAAVTLLHGMWFWEAAYVLYPPHGEPWEQDSHENIAFLTMFFTWYMILSIVVVGAIFTFFGLMSRRKHRYDDFGKYTPLQHESIP